MCVATTIFASRAGWAQEIEPNEFVPAPDGSNLALFYYIYGHNEGYNVAKGPTIPNSGLEVNLGIARYVHYDYIKGFPAGFQILQAFGSESAGHIDGESLGSTFGASNVNLSAFIWPYSSTERKQYLVLTGFLQPPTGSYNKYQALNVASAFGATGWSGVIQLGWDHGIGSHFSYDLEVDGQIYGDVTRPGGQRVSQDSSVRFQAWANWNWTRAFQTSLGWESIIGGTQYTNGFQNGTKSEMERMRVATSMFVAPNAQVLLELNHDFVAVGSFKQIFGLTTRLLYVF